jgi:mannose-6-phosphate isomerase-like protein (cupin superfamily)
MSDKVNVKEKFGLFTEHWSPKVVGELNGQLIKLVKFSGDFVWHSHEHEDEMFLVIRGRFRMDYREGSEWIETGEFVIVPRGIEHKPYAEEEVEVMLFEPASTVNTGDAGGDRTRLALDQI